MLRQDFLDPRVLTEDDVLELHEFRIREGGARNSEKEEELPEGFELERSFDEELP